MRRKEQDIREEEDEDENQRENNLKKNTSYSCHLPLQILEDPDGGGTLRVEVGLLLLLRRRRRRKVGVSGNETFQDCREDAHDRLTLSFFAGRGFHDNIRLLLVGWRRWGGGVPTTAL